VSLTVVFRETALRNLARIRGEDRDLFIRTRRVVALLADQPYLEGAVAWGTTPSYRPCRAAGRLNVAKRSQYVMTGAEDGGDRRAGRR
jgi:hypothetical protein